MHRHIPQPLDARRLQRDRGIQAARDGVVNDAQLLLRQQPDEFALGFDEAGDMGILRTQVGDDLVLFRARWLQQRDVEELVRIQTQTRGSDAGGAPDVFGHVGAGAQQVVEIRWVEAVGTVRPINAVCRADYAKVPARAKRGHPCPEGVDDDVAGLAQL